MFESFQAMYFDGTYPTKLLPEEEEALRPKAQVPGGREQIMGDTLITQQTKRPKRESRDITPLSVTEVGYTQALTALKISPVFIKRTLHTKRASESGLGLTSVQKRKFEAQIDAAIDQLKTPHSQGEIPWAVAESLVKQLGEDLSVNLIERGVKFDLANGDKRILSRWKKDHEAYEDWKRDVGGRKYVIDEDGEKVPVAKALYGAYERDVRHVNPRLDMIAYMAEIIAELWSAASIVT